MQMRYLGASIATFTIFGIFQALPLKAASGLGGWIARTFGPRFRRHRIARKNLRLALPEFSEAEAEKILGGMWDDLGRTIAEFPHLGEFGQRLGGQDDLIAIEGLDHLKQIRDGQGAAIFVSGHISNWELAPLVLRPFEIEAIIIYHSLHTDYADRAIQKFRSAVSPQLMENKGQGKKMIAALKNGKSISMLVDQKPRRGPLMNFFGRPAKMETTHAKLALRYGLPIVPVRVQRLDGVKFKITVSPPMDVTGIEPGDQGAAEVTAAVNKILEGWIRERPSQWHWLHRRWPDT